MKGKIGKLFSDIAAKVLISAKRFPEAIFCALSASVLAVLLNRGSDVFTKDTIDILSRTAMVLALLFPVSLIGANISARIKKAKISRVIIDVLIAGFGVLYYFTLLPEMNFVKAVTYFAVSFAAYLLYISIVDLKVKHNFEVYTVSLAVRFLITYLYSLVLYGGIAAIFLTVNFLFALNIDSKIYIDLLIIVAGIFAPAFFLADIPENDKEYAVSAFSNIIRILLLYIVMPIVSVYTAILYVYLVKVIIGGIPNNMIANLILWYSIVGSLVTFLIYPFRSINRWASVFVRFFPKILLPLLAMLFYSIGLRVSQHGFTEARYYVVVAGIWVFGAMVYLSIKKDAKNILLPISLAIIAVLTVVGPLSAFGVSIASQNSQLNSILEKNHMLAEGKVTKGVDVSNEDIQDISSILSYFDSMHKLSDVKALPSGFTFAKTENVFGFQLYSGNPDTNKFKYFTLAVIPGSSADISGYDFMIDVSQVFDQVHTYTENNVAITFDRNQNTLAVSYMGEKLVDKDLKEYVQQLLADNPDLQYEKQFASEDLAFRIETDKLNIKIIFSRIDGTYENDLLTYLNMNFVILVQVK